MQKTLVGTKLIFAAETKNWGLDNKLFHFWNINELLQEYHIIVYTLRHFKHACAAL